MFRIAKKRHKTWLGAPSLCHAFWPSDPTQLPRHQEQDQLKTETDVCQLTTPVFTRTLSLTPIQIPITRPTLKLLQIHLNFYELTRHYAHHGPAEAPA